MSQNLTIVNIPSNMSKSQQQRMGQCSFDGQNDTNKGTRCHWQK